MTAMDRKGILTFLLLTFGITFVYEGCLLASGINMNFGLSSSGPMPPAYAAILVGLVINGVFGFGEELGWRGYLLPKLMPLGKWKAYILVGVIWGFWHAPLILVGFNYSGFPILGVVAMIGMTTTLGFYINEMTLRHRSSILAGWMHGAFNGQFYGIWRILFPNVHPLLGGVTGLIGMCVWAGLGLAVAQRAHGRPSPGSDDAVAGRDPSNRGSV